MIASIYPDTLLPVSLYSFVLTLTAIIMGPYVGSWAVSSQRSRLTTLRTSIAVQKLSIATTACLLWLINAGFDRNGVLFGLAIFSGSVLRLASRATTIGVEKEWAVIICNSQHTLQTKMNSALRRVDLVCKLAAPLAVSLLAIPLSVPQTMLCVSACVLMSIPIELSLITSVYHGCRALQIREDNSDTSPDSATSATTLHPLQPPPTLLGKWSLYIHHPMFLSSLAISLLYLTSLSFGNVMTTFLLSENYTPSFLALMRSLSVLAGLLATFTAPYMILHFGLISTGLTSIWSQVACLLPALYSFDILSTSRPLATTLFFSGITLSRIGLWSFDISHLELVQLHVTGETDMGAFNGCEFALQNVFELVSYLVTMVWNRPDEFWIQAIIACATSLSIPIVARSGGHSYQALSLIDQGIVVDLSHFTSIKINTKNQTAIIGAGNWLGRVYVKLEAKGFSLPGGDCPTVGIAGHTLGGGFGLISRQFGVILDWLVEVRLVDAEGNVRVVNENTDSQLFWAIRGNGAGNFGIVTSFKFKLIPSKSQTLTYQVYSWDDTANFTQLISAYIDQAPNLSNEITCSLFTSSVRSDTGLSIVRWNANFSDGAIDPMIAAMPPPINVGTQIFSSYVEVVMALWGVTRANLLDKPSIETTDSFAATSIFTGPGADSASIASLIDAFLINPSTSVQMDNWGGAVSTNTGKTSFIHRGNFMGYQAIVSITDTTDPSPRDSLESWRSSMEPFSISEAYQNYIDLSIPPSEYFGAQNLPILQSVKRRLDPSNVWGYAGGIEAGVVGSCGDGNVGNGICVTVGECCDSDGVCGVGSAFCWF
ncbi:hypothetical protein HDU98_001335 [Podochytrium sp. JEL0797]|nr:hypothetical protein HDU98_001335 [Podochytrium sp. JEL0797]